MRPAAHIVSYLFHPILLPTTGLLLILSLDSYVGNTTPPAKKVFLLSWIFINTALIPFLFTAFLRWKKMIQSIHLDDQHDRTLPFTFTLFFYITNYFLLRDIPMPTVIYSMFLGTSFAVAIALIVNFFTKISIHMIGMGGLTAAIYGMGQLYELDVAVLIALWAILSGFVGTARFILESHNLRQIYLGWCAGFVAVYVPLILEWG